MKGAHEREATHIYRAGLIGLANERGAIKPTKPGLGWIAGATLGADHAFSNRSVGIELQAWSLGKLNDNSRLRNQSLENLVGTLLGGPLLICVPRTASTST
jgi:hypothetical protein